MFSAPKAVLPHSIYQQSLISIHVCVSNPGPCPARDLYSEAQVAELLVQILSAVDYLHGRRVIHLDLKSDNILVDDCNQLKIVDLGSAQLFTPGQPLNIEHIQGLSESRGTDPAHHFALLYVL